MGFMVIPPYVWDDETFTATDKIVFGAIISFRESRYCTLPPEELCEIAKVTMDELENSIKVLHNAKVIAVHLDSIELVRELM